MKTRVIFTIVALVTAFSSVFHWYWLRLDDGAGEPFGLIALGLAIFFGSKNRNPSSPRLAEIAIIVYAIGFFILPPLLRTIPALATIAFLAGIHRQAGQFGLLMLSLPIQASLDFFLGYPFRVITAEGSRLFLNVLGYSVERLGVQLSLKGVIVSVDPPCSGLQMLWATAFFTALLSALFRLDYRRTFILGTSALLLCLLANTVRATTLFFPESGIFTLPDFAHEGIGLIYFALASLALAGIARKLHKRKQESPFPRVNISRRFLGLACGVSLITLLPAKTSPNPSPAGFTPITEYRGHAVEEIPLSPYEDAFAKNFPGQLKVYRVGFDTLIVRHITKASRKLHPSYHCLKAEGYTISDPRVEEDDEGRPFLSYHATRNHERFLVSEKIRTIDNSKQWTEISAWYWSALFNPDCGPWEAETLLTPLP